MSDNEQVVSIQREIVAAERAKRIVDQARNAKDIRRRIAQAGHYNPQNDPVTEYIPYPKWVTPPGSDKPVLVNTKAEHDAAMGVKAEPAKAVNVDVASLAQPAAVKEKRKYTKRAVAPQPLPQNLD